MYETTTKPRLDIMMGQQQAVRTVLASDYPCPDNKNHQKTLIYHVSPIKVLIDFNLINFVEEPYWGLWPLSVRHPACAI